MDTRQVLLHPFLCRPAHKAPQGAAGRAPLATKRIRPIKQLTRRGTLEVDAEGRLWMDLHAEPLVHRISADGLLVPRACLAGAPTAF